MAIFAIFDVTCDQDLSEHDRLCDAYREIDRLNLAHNTVGGERFAVRLARAHRSACAPQHDVLNAREAAART